MSIDSYLFDVSVFIVFLVAVLGVILFKPGNKSVRYFTGLMISHFVFQFFASDIYLLIGQTTLYYKLVIIIYLFFEYAFFLNLLPDRKYRRIISIFFGIGGLVLISHYIDSFSNPNNLTTSMLLVNAVTLLSCFMFYIHMMRNISLQPLFRQWEFIIVTGFFVYSLGSSGATITSSYAIQVGLENRDMYIMDMLIYIIELCIFFWGLWVYRAELKSNQKLKLKNANVE